MIPIPQSWEKLGRFLPRPFLNWLEIHGSPEIVPLGDVAGCINFWKSRKIALVKQTSYWGMYNPTGKNTSWEDIVMGNQGHLGPMSFLADLGADYIVVHQEKDDECFRWRDKYVHCPDPTARFQARLAEMDAWLLTPAGRGVARCDDIPWNQYDLVVSMDLALPDRIVKKCPRTFWAYFSTEPGSPLQKESLRGLRSGYSVFLNHGFRKYRSRPWNQSHVLEFPYSFQSTGAWSALGRRIGVARGAREGILVEKGSWREPSFKSSIKQTRLEGDMQEYLKQMFSHRYAIRTDPKSRWGNWAIEAIMAGNLFLGNPSALDHRSLFLPCTNCHELLTAVRRAEKIEAESRWSILQSLQMELAEHLSFRRPLIELTKRAKDFFTP